MGISFKIILIIAILLCVYSIFIGRKSHNVFGTRIRQEFIHEDFDDYDAADSALRAPAPPNVDHKKDIEIALPHDTDPAMKSLMVNAHQIHAKQQTESYYDNEIDVHGVLGDTSCEATGSPFLIPPDPHCFMTHDEEGDMIQDGPTIASSSDLGSVINTDNPFDNH